MRRREFVEKLEKVNIVAQVHKDIAGIEVFDSPLLVKGNREEIETPYRLLIIRKDGRVKGMTVVSWNYQLILHRELVEEVKKNAKIIKEYTNKDIGVFARILLETPKEVGGGKKVCFLIENSYRADRSARLYLFLREGSTLFPVGLLMRRIHKTNSITSNWKEVMETTKKLLQLLEESQGVKTSLDFIKGLREVETVYYRKKDGLREIKRIRIGEELYNELLTELGDSPTIYELWESLCRKNYERRKGLTLVAKRKIEKIILSLLQLVEERKRMGMKPRFVVAPKEVVGATA
jgi:hypothetical protein